MAGRVAYPPDHEAGMRVPKGGSMCANCKYLGPQNTCKNKYWIKWEGKDKPSGSDKIPAPINEYCSDFYEPRATLRAALQRVS